MKKIISLVMVLAMAIAVFACAAGAQHKRQRYTQQHCILVYFIIFHAIIVPQPSARLQ